jgi:ribonuclease R
MPATPRALAHGRTIDPPDAADLDDAIDVRKHPWGWRVCASIADVAEHVPLGGEIDQQAYEQGFSHYFADRQDPMLPMEMAVDRLSLLAGQPRDTLTFRLDLDADFAVTALDIQKTRLQSDAQLTYDDVSAVLDAPHHPDYPYWRDALDLAYGLFRQRQGHGALAVFDPLSGRGSTEEGRLVRLPEGAACRAYLIVQELMILVNHAVTHHLTDQGLPLLFRNHTLRPDDASADDLSDIEAFRLDPSAERLGHLQARLGHLFNRAVYQPVTAGHVGLGLSCYAHWTSPIRRYSDLVNHRQLRAWLDGDAPPYSHEGH